MQCVPINTSSNWVHFKYMNQTVDKVFRKLPQMTSVQSTADRELYTFSFEKARYSNSVEFVEF